ncbi:uncharacterized protein BT62DRAFT_1010974 [Guyanagaster necrorhizus]|uniref:Protein kinase domain-containing protein n=1 Tax=Guyanagaster necrorhizus TaxID=856835 RepID=A0A9P7VJX9_9AGAR|nr:uncharacterized protein BT62DRAFT_1010974 [Guyanagaster necrorhizus MCA 3950]KAG7441938.1 hypothetical protein BT62DRAFT_1010974 [Guyanagaster necrorhizus MCA 3950]
MIHRKSTTISAEQEYEASQRKRIDIRELDNHSHVSCHPNIVTFHKAIFHDEFFYVVPDLCEGGDLFDTILQKSFYPRDDSVYHRNIKPENIICSEDGSRIYLTDFGMSTQNKTSTFHDRISLTDLQREIAELETFFSDEPPSDSSSHNSPVLLRSISWLGSTPPSEIGAMHIDDTGVLLVARSTIEAGVTGDDSLALDLRAIHLVGVDRPVSAPAIMNSQFVGDESGIMSVPLLLQAIHPVMSCRSIVSSVDSDRPIEGEGIGELDIAFVVKDDDNDIQPADLADGAGSQKKRGVLPGVCSEIGCVLE